MCVSIRMMSVLLKEWQPSGFCAETIEIRVLRLCCAVLVSGVGARVRLITGHGIPGHGILGHGILGPVADN